MGNVVWMIKWVLVLILVCTIGWAVSVSRKAGTALGPAAVMAVDGPAQAEVSVAPAPIPIQAAEVNYAGILERDPFAGTGAPSPTPARSDSMGLPLCPSARYLALP